MPIFLLDTNAISSLRLAHKPGEFGPAWQLVARKAQSGEVFIPREVLEEVSDRPCEKWIKGQPNLILEATSLQQQCLLRLVRALPAFHDPNKTSIDADQPLVAYAMAVNRMHTAAHESGPACVVTNERHRQGNEPRLRIPDACDHFGIEVCGLFDMFASFGAFNGNAP